VENSQVIGNKNDPLKSEAFYSSESIYEDYSKEEESFDEE